MSHIQRGVKMTPSQKIVSKFYENIGNRINSAPRKIAKFLYTPSQRHRICGFERV